MAFEKNKMFFVACVCVLFFWKHLIIFFQFFPSHPLSITKKKQLKNQHRFLCSIKSLDGTFIIIEFTFHFTLGGSLFWYFPYMNKPLGKEKGYYMYLQKVGGVIFVSCLTPKNLSHKKWCVFHTYILRFKKIR